MGREFVLLELGGLTEQIFARARAMYGGAQSPMVVKMLEEAVDQFVACRASPRSSRLSEPEMQ